MCLGYLLSGGGGDGDDGGDVMVMVVMVLPLNGGDGNGGDGDGDGDDDDLLATQQSLPAAKIVPFAAPKVEIATERGISQAIGPEIYNVRSVLNDGGGDQLLIF